MPRKNKESLTHLTPEYVRRAYMAQFAAMDAAGRASVIEALGVLHDVRLAEERMAATTAPPITVEAE